MTDSTDPFSPSVTQFQMPEEVRKLADKSVSKARESYTKLKDAAETGNETMEAVFTTATKGATDYSSKVLDMAKANTTAGIDFMQEIIGVKSLSAAMDVFASFARNRVEAMTEQGKELAEMSKKIATETAEPIKAGASKLFKPAA